MTVRPVPDVHPALISTLLSEVRDARDAEWQQARVVAERGLRARSDTVLRALAFAATGGGTWDDAVRQAVDGNGKTPTPESHPWWAALGRVVTMHAQNHDDFSSAVCLFDQAYKIDPERPFGRPDYLAYVQALWDTDQMERINDVPRRQDTLEEGEADFISLNLLRKAGSIDSWLHALNGALMSPAGLTPITLDLQARTKFDGLAAEQTELSQAPVLISVVMSSYRRGAELATAVQSILAQTWSNFELIIVDDCSGPSYDAALEQVAALDPRITVLRQDFNQGTYQARNRALEMARGEFVTFQDDDDWSHPQRLERQAAPLLADPLVHSTLSHAVQADDDLMFRHASRRTRLMNSSSLMFRRRNLEELGGFDTVRKAADTEFIRRLRAALPGRQVLLAEALAFVRLTGGSLSRTDFKPGWNHPTRSEYAEAADWWHRSIFKGASARISDSPSVRTFPAPQRFVSAQLDRAPEYDLIVVADFSSPLVVAGPGWQLMYDAVKRGERVGVLPLDNPYRVETAGRTRITDAARELLNSGVVTRVFPDEDAVCGRLVVDDPAILQFADHSMWGLKVSHVDVLCHTGPVEVESTSYWSHADCVQMLADVLPASRPTWVAVNGTVRQLLNDSGLIATEPAPVAAVGISRELFVNGPRQSGRPVIGRIGSRAQTGWLQTKDELTAAYPQDGSLDVRILGDLGTTTRTLGEAPARWLHYHGTDVGLDSFLAQLDVYVHASLAPPTLLEERVMMRAIGFGTPVVLIAPESSLPAGAVIRCEAGEVRAEVKSLCESPSRYQDAVEQARGALERAGLITAGE